MNTQTQKTAGLVVHNCKACAQEVEAGASRVQVHPQLYSEFRASLGCIRACLKIQISKQNTGEYTHPTKRFKMPWTDRQQCAAPLKREIRVLWQHWQASRWQPVARIPGSQSGGRERGWELEAWLWCKLIIQMRDPGTEQPDHSVSVQFLSGICGNRMQLL